MSARLVSVDAQMPGGSGLVPVMVAAVTAGPSAVGSMAFFSNVPSRWDSWREIEDFCLSAGVAVHPWAGPPDGDGDGDGPDAGAVARTSHVIFFDPERADGTSQLPRQRLIMDVQGLADSGQAEHVIDWASLMVPPARPDSDLQTAGREDFLFVDKEVVPSVIAEWQGPTVYETGATGDELVTRLAPVGARPTIWTAGIGSLVRTLVALAGRNLATTVAATEPRHVLEHVEADDRVALFAQCEDLRERYFAKVISFDRPGIWDFGGVEGFTYQDELEYGAWLRDRWPNVAAATWSLLGSGDKAVLSEPHPRIGGGLLTTIHEGGLMALWRWPDGRSESIAIRVDTSPAATDDDGRSFTVTTDVQHTPSQVKLDPISVHVDHEEILLAVGEHEEPLGRTDPIRRNTLAAGDTVRGVFAYGLWQSAYRQGTEPIDLTRILLASAALATLKCYAGSFIDFLKLLERLRGTPTWNAIWGDAW
jgi:hypothetical protein